MLIWNDENLCLHFQEMPTNTLDCWCWQRSLWSTDRIQMGDIRALELLIPSEAFSFVMFLLHSLEHFFLPKGKRTFIRSSCLHRIAINIAKTLFHPNVDLRLGCELSGARWDPKTPSWGTLINPKTTPRLRTRVSAHLSVLSTLRMQRNCRKLSKMCQGY